MNRIAPVNLLLCIKVLRFLAPFWEERHVVFCRLDNIDAAATNGFKVFVPGTFIDTHCMMCFLPFLGRALEICLQSVSGRPPPAASMAIGQFFNPKEGEVELSPTLLLRAIYDQEVDPHCSYKVSASVSLSAAASRFTLLYSSQIIGFMTAVIFFALMRLAHAWELDLPLPSILMAIELNLRMPLSFLLLAVLPIFVYLFLSLLLTAQSLPSVASFITVSILCYVIANGCVIILILSSLFILYISAFIHTFIKRRWQAWEENYSIIFIRQIFNFSSILYSFKVVRILRGNPSIVLAFVTVPLVTFVHPALGLISLLLFHAYHCHVALCSFLAASFRSERKEMFDSESKGVKPQSGGAFDQFLPLDEIHSNSPGSGKSFVDTQLELFNYRHGLLILHLLAALMFVPSLVAWLQRTRMSQSFPWLLDSALCVGVILHGLCGWKPDVNALKFTLPGIPYRDVGLNLVYLLAGYYCYLYALAAAPFIGIYAMAAVGAIYFASWVIEKRNGEKSDGHFGRTRRHSHKH